MQDNKIYTNCGSNATIYFMEFYDLEDSLIPMKIIDSERLQIIGANLLKLREERGLSQEELSYRCDVDRAKISKIETGKANLYVTTLIELAKGLDVHPKELLDVEFG